MATAKISGDAWSILLPEHRVDIADGVSIAVRPLSLEAWAQILKWVESAAEDLKGAGVTLDALNRADGVTRLLNFVLSSAPWVLSLATGLDEEDVKRLPLPAAVRLLEGVLDINNVNVQHFQERVASVVGKLTGVRQMVQ